MLSILALPNFGRSRQAVRPEGECYISFAKAGHDVTVMVNESNAYLDDYRKSKVKVIILDSPRKYSWTAIRQIRQYIKSKQIDIVYATDSSYRSGTEKPWPTRFACCIRTELPSTDSAKTQ
jgi:hypothetical protein